MMAGLLSHQQTGRWLGWLAVAALTMPMAYTAWISFSPDSLLTPPTHDWSLKWYAALAADRRWTTAITQSLIVGVLASIISTLAATAAALALRRLAAAAQGAVMLGMLLPVMTPPAAWGTGLLPLVYMTGLWGTAAALALVHGVLGMPIALLVLRSFLTERIEELESAARGLGARPGEVYRRVTLPLLRPAMITAALAAFLISLNESLLTLFLATPTNETLPAIIWPQLRFSASPLVAAGSCLIGVVGVGCIALLMRWVRTIHDL